MSRGRRGEPGKRAPGIPKLPESHLCMALCFLPFPEVSGLAVQWQLRGLPSSESTFTYHSCQGCHGLVLQGQEAPGPSSVWLSPPYAPGLDGRSGSTRACLECEWEGKVTPEMLGSGGGEICESLTLCGRQTLLGSAMDVL